MSTSPTRVLFSSHDGYGLGHVRRNARLASALRQRLPDARLTLVTGVASEHPWLGADAVEVVRVPTLVKDARGRYRNQNLSLEDAVAQRARRFEELVERVQPELVVVDRHPFGIRDELRPGLSRARRAGAVVVLGLRDVLDEPKAVRAELSGPGWRGVRHMVDEILVYGQRVICDQEREYRLPLRPTYCGIVVDELPRQSIPQEAGNTLVVSAGGGADGQGMARLARKLSKAAGFENTILIVGPAGTTVEATSSRRLTVHPTVDDCGPLLAGAAASLQMAGYNSTYEALSAGIRPLLVPRRAPRREQAIRATRLTALGLADVVDPGASSSEIAWLLRRPRRLPPGAVQDAGVSLDGATVAVDRICHLLGQASRGAA